VHTIGGACIGKRLVRLGLVDVSVGVVTVINISCWNLERAKPVN